MKRNLLTLLAMIFLCSTFILTGCDDAPTNVQVTNYGGEGLDLEAAGKLAAKCANADEYAKKLNDTDNGVNINNLDLDEDGKPEMLVVTEENTNDPGLKAFSVTAVLSHQDVAVGNRTGQALLDDPSILKHHVFDVKFEKEKSGQTYAMAVVGNDKIYGDNHVYSSSGLSLGDVLFLNWLFSPRPYYYPVYSAWYPGYAWVPYSTYRSTVVARYRTVNVGHSTSFSRVTPTGSRMGTIKTNASKSYATERISAPISKPSAAQSNFQKQNPSKQYSGGGFGKSSGGIGSASRASGSGSGYNSPSRSGGSSPSRTSGSAPSRTSSGGRSGRR